MNNCLHLQVLQLFLWQRDNLPNKVNVHLYDGLNCIKLNDYSQEDDYFRIYLHKSIVLDKVLLS